jgi:hypothetical protein
MLIPHNLRASFDLAQSSRQIAMHLAQAAQLANQQAETLLELPSEALASWLNSQESPQALFTAHGVVGAALNAAQAAGAQILQSSGLTVRTVNVDVRSFPEKLAGTGRTIEITDGVAYVVELPAPAADASVTSLGATDDFGGDVDLEDVTEG